jgi:hypothetical protein
MSTVIVQRLKRPIDCDDNRALYDASRLADEARSDFDLNRSFPGCLQIHRTARPSAMAAPYERLRVSAPNNTRIA